MWWKHCFMFLLVLCRRVREAGEVRAQTEARVQVMSLAYSSVYGNKVTKLLEPFLRQIFGIYYLTNFQVRKLWKNLAKSDLLTSASYDFQNPNKCKVWVLYISSKGSTLKSSTKTLHSLMGTGQCFNIEPNFSENVDNMSRPQNIPTCGQIFSNLTLNSKLGGLSVTTKR